MSDLLTKQDQQQINELDELLKKDPTNVDALIRKGFILFTCVKNDEAIETFKQAIKIKPQCVDAYFWLAECLWSNIADYEQAAFFAREALTIDPNRADIHQILAWSIKHLYEDKNYQGQNKFLYHINKAIEIEPTWIAPRISLIEYLINQKHFTLANQEIENTLKKIQDNFPIPTDDIKYFYEEYITRRCATDNRKTLQEFSKKIKDLSCQI